MTKKKRTIEEMAPCELPLDGQKGDKEEGTETPGLGCETPPLAIRRGAMTQPPNFGQGRFCLECMYKDFENKPNPKCRLYGNQIWSNTGCDSFAEEP